MLQQRIAITGHTSGIGLALTKQCDNWIGFSRRNGFDINNPDFILDNALHCDVFVNNAHDKFGQVDLLYALWSEWKAEHKHIVCISSLSPDVTKNRMYPYSAEKNALDHVCEQLQNSKEKNCKVTNIKLGWVNTPRVERFHTRHKMNPDYVAEVISWCIKQPEYVRTLRLGP